MRILFDSSIIVEIDRQNEQVINLLKKLVIKKHELIISTITVSEILTGSYLRKDSEEAVIKAREVLNQFNWKEFDNECAENSAKLLAFLIVEKKEKSVDYPDILIASTFMTLNCDYLITLNKKDFIVFPKIREFVLDYKELDAKFNLK